MSFLSVNYTEQNHNILSQNYAKGKQNVMAKESVTAKAISTQDMTMEDYKQYIHDKISQIPINPTQSGYNWNIEITDEGFEAMKNNPEYETYVLDCIRTNFSGTDPFRTSNYSILHFGANKAESYGIGWCTDNSDLKESKNSFWERKAERKERIEAQQKKAEQKRRLRKEAVEEAAEKAAYEKYVLHTKLMAQSNRTISASPNVPVSQTVHRTSATNAAASYEANFSINE